MFESRVATWYFGTLLNVAVNFRAITYGVKSACHCDVVKHNVIANWCCAFAVNFATFLKSLDFLFDFDF